MAKPLDLPYDKPTRCAARYAWMEAMRPMGWAVFLDSGDPARSGGRYDILAAAPRAVVTAREDAFAAARRLVQGERSHDSDEWPVAGAAIGYFGYELGRESAGLARDKSRTCTSAPYSQLDILSSHRPGGSRSL